MELVTTVQVDPLTKAVTNAFDFEFAGRSSFTVPRLPDLPDTWGIGLIVGPSGSGKSSLLRSRFGDEQRVEWATDRSVCSHFIDEEDAIARLGAVGLNSIPTWTRPYYALSTGEKFRADLARRLGDNAVIDEFTSVVDRNVAKACSVALHRYVDRATVRCMVLASCHYDIVDWLQPEWWFDTATGRLESGCRSRRPTITLDLLPCTVDAWPVFSPHHYLDADINRSARCWLAMWGDTVVGFTSAIAFPNGNFNNAWREHRTVILPDFQGLGLGVRVSDAVATIFVAQGCRYFSKTSHPRMGEYRNNSALWRATSKNRKSRPDYNGKNRTKEDGHKMRHAARLCFSHEFVGDDFESLL